MILSARRGDVVGPVVVTANRHRFGVGTEPRLKQSHAALRWSPPSEVAAQEHIPFRPVVPSTHQTTRCQVYWER